MTELRRRMLEDMKLHGLAASTQQIYINAIRRWPSISTARQIRLTNRRYVSSSSI